MLVEIGAKVMDRWCCLPLTDLKTCGQSVNDCGQNVDDLLFICFGLCYSGLSGGCPQVVGVEGMYINCGVAVQVREAGG